MDRFNLKLNTEQLQEWREHYDTGHSRLLALQTNAQQALAIAATALAAAGDDAADTGAGMAAYMFSKEPAALEAVATALLAHAQGTGQTGPQVIAKLQAAMGIE